MIMLTTNKRMPLDYMLQESTLPGKDGERKLFPKIRLSRHLTHEEFLGQVELFCTVTAAETNNVLQNVSDTLLKLFQQGWSVKIDGLGTFKIALGMEEGLPAQTVKRKGERYDTQHVCVKDVQFIADKQWLADIRSSIQLHKYGKADEIREVRKHLETREERRRMALEYLDHHHFMRVSDYAFLTGLPRSSACKEIRAFASDPNSGIEGVGRGNQRMYVRSGTDSSITN